MGRGLREGEGEGEGEGGLRCPVPSFPLRRGILAQGGSLLVSMYLVLVVLATCFRWPTYPSLSWAQFHAVCRLDGLTWGGSGIPCMYRFGTEASSPLYAASRWGEGGVRGLHLPPLSSVCWRIT